MISKTSAVEQKIVEYIASGQYGTGKKIPSRNRLAEKLGCSRTTVERAVARLVQSGYLAGEKGSGTRVISASPSKGIKEIRIVSSSADSPDWFSFSELMLSNDFGNLRVRWIKAAEAAENFEALSAPGGAVVWVMPGEELIMLMDRLRLKKIPQILINREYRDFDCIVTDSRSSIREGLSWLLIEAGREIAFVCRRASTDYPYLHSRIISFYETALELGAHLGADSIFSRDYTDIPEEMEEIGGRIWGKSQPVSGIFVMNQDLALPLVMTGRRYGFTPGKDYFLLCFDEPKELIQQNGVAMMRQPFRLFPQELMRWLKLVVKNQDGDHSFVSALKTELIFGKQG